ncbi:MAG: hypothetical protein AAF970_05385 [Bacteroidota bacterium]
MEPTSTPPSSLGAWLAQPQSLIALSAVVLSLCGLFIAVYEASLIRQSQRAAVWPYVEIAPSLNRESVRLGMVNVGIGPARVEAAAVFHDGVLLEDWRAMSRAVLGARADSVDYRQSLAGGRVLAAGQGDAIFTLTSEMSRSPETGRRAVAGMRQAIVDGALEVTVCYCSVYDECWTISMQNMLGAASAEAPPGNQPVESCDGAPRSGI